MSYLIIIERYIQLKTWKNIFHLNERYIILYLLLPKKDNNIILFNKTNYVLINVIIHQEEIIIGIIE